MSNNEVIKILNGLIETCMERQDSFRTAAEDIPNSEFRRLFNIFSQQRAQFVTELQAEARRIASRSASGRPRIGSRYVQLRVLTIDNCDRGWSRDPGGVRARRRSGSQ